MDLIMHYAIKVSLVIIVSIRVNQIGVAVFQYMADQTLLIFLFCLIRLIKVLVVIQQDLFVKQISIISILPFSCCIVRLCS